MSTFKGFDTVQLNRPKKSSFDLTHDKRLSMLGGVLTPILITECVPSDKFRGSSEVLMRLAPLLAPIYDQIQLYVHYFFIPNRLLWAEWEEMITGGRLGVGIDPVTAPIPPRLDVGDLLGTNSTFFDKSSLGDYLGIPNFLLIEPDPVEWEGKFIDAMPFAAYHLVWQEYYRDRNMLDDDYNGLAFPLASGTLTDPIQEALMDLHARCYRPDYFTSALPFTQRGEEVLMPVSLGGNAPIYANPPGWTPGDTTLVNGTRNPGSISVGMGVNSAADPGDIGTADLWVRGQDFDGTSTSINDFRSAYALQVWLERNAIGGSRYTESTQAHFGVKPQDSRLQRPEYIGGGRISVKISEVLATAWSQNASDNDVPLGNMAGHGITYGNTNQFSYFCTEHGFILGLASILAPASYQQGLPRMFRRGTFLDYPWPTFAKLGEQPVYDFEIYTTPASLTPDSEGEPPVFAYQSRYSDWKWLPTTNHGEFKESLLFWTLTRTFSSPPIMQPSFVAFPPDVFDRIFATSSSGQFWLYVHNKISVQRPLPYFGVPNTLGFS